MVSVVASPLSMMFGISIFCGKLSLAISPALCVVGAVVNIQYEMPWEGTNMTDLTLNTGGEGQ